MLVAADDSLIMMRMACYWLDGGMPVQGGSSRVIAPDGRDIEAVPDSVFEIVTRVVLGTLLRHRIGWSAGSLHSRMEQWRKECAALTDEPAGEKKRE